MDPLDKDRLRERLLRGGNKEKSYSEKRRLREQSKLRKAGGADAVQRPAWDGSDDVEREAMRRARQVPVAAREHAAAEPTRLERALVVALAPARARVRIGVDEHDAALANDLAARQQSEVAVGDQVLVERNDDLLVVRAVEPRRSRLSRPDPANAHRERVLAANVDLALIVVSVSSPPFKPALIDRMLIAIEHGGVAPAIVVNTARTEVWMKSMHRWVIGNALCLALVACSATDERVAPEARAPVATPNPPADELAAHIDAACASWAKPDSPGCAVGVVRDGGLVFARGYGMANLEHALPITAQSVFDIGSTSKQFTAACIGLLVESGALALDDDVRKWIPELPDYGHTLRLRHLLHHTSGLRDYLELFMLAGRKSEDWTTSAQALAMLARQKALNFEPGSQHLYSNSGYFLLSLVVERASGSSLAQFARQQLFEPLGMRDTHFHDDHRRIVPGRATAYSPREQGGFGIDMSDFEQTGDGAVMTTVEDLAKWDQNFYTHEVGGEALQRFLHECGRLNDGSELDYAAGLVVDTFRGLRRVCHGGAWAGYRAQVMRFPEQRLTVICISNLGSIDPSEICVRVANFALAEPMDDTPPQAERRARRSQADAGGPTPPVLTPDELTAFAGVYESDELEVRAEIAVRGTSLFMGEVGLTDFELPPLGPDRFGAFGFAVAFERDATGAVTGFKAGSGRMHDVAFARSRR